MAIAPMISGGVIVEVRKEEYDELVRISERVDTIERIVNNTSYYLSTEDFLAMLGIKKKTEANTENTN